MSFLKKLFGPKLPPEPDAVAVQLQAATDEHTNAVTRFADMMRDMVEENKRIREHLEETSDAVPVYREAHIGVGKR